MKNFLTFALLASACFTQAYARPSSSSSFSSSYSRPSSSYSYSSSRSSSIFSYSRPSYSYSRPSYAAPRSYTPPPVVSHSTTVIHGHTNSGGGFGSSFLGGMAGAVVGNALSGPHGSLVGPPPVYSNEGYSLPPQVSDPQVVSQGYDNSSAGNGWIWGIVASLFALPFAIVGGILVYSKTKKKTIYDKPRSTVASSIAKASPLYPKNPGLVPGVIVNIPKEFGDDTGVRSFVMDNVGTQEVTAIGKNDAFAHLYLGDAIDEDFVRVFVSSDEGGKPREAWAFSNVHNIYFGYMAIKKDVFVHDGKTYRFLTYKSHHTHEVISNSDGEKWGRSVEEALYQSDDEFLLIRNIEDGPSRAQRFYAGVSIPVSYIA